MKTIKKLLFLLVLGFTMATGKATAQTLTSNQTTYTPGLSVTLTGSGYAANEAVSLQVVYIDNTPETNTAPWVVTADINGDFTTTWDVPTDPTVVIANLKITANARTSASSVELVLNP